MPLSPRFRNPTPDRLVSLDVFRGLTVAAMILVTDPGTYTAVYWPLRHAEWQGATPTDMIFPSFLFIVGISVTLSFAARLTRGDTRRNLAFRVLRRTLLLIILGLLVNGFPDYAWHTLRLPGILQRIALCYAAASLIYLAVFSRPTVTAQSSPRSRLYFLIVIAAALLAGYWALLRFYPTPGFGPARFDPLGNLPAVVDRAIFGIAHIWPYGLTPGVGVTYDPEGLLSTLPAIATTLFGVIAGEWMRTTRRSGIFKAATLLLAGALLILAGQLLSPAMPINKRIWTSTFALFAGGVSLCLFAVFYALIDLRRAHRWTVPGMILGTNAIFAFVLSSIITTLADRIRLGSAEHATLHQRGYAAFLATGLAPIQASLAYALAIVLLNLLLVYPLFRKRIFLRL